MSSARSRPAVRLAVASGVDLAAAIDAFLSQPDLAPTTPAKYRQTLMVVEDEFVQRVLDDPAWTDRRNDDDRRGLTPLFRSNINPYGTFHLDMTRRLDIDRPGEPVTAT